MRIAIVLLLWLALATPALAQGTGASFTTPSGQLVPGFALLVPCGAITNGQPTYCPPGPLDDLHVFMDNLPALGPVDASSQPISGTVAATNVFQSLLSQYSTRKGCDIVNTGSHVEYFSDNSTPTIGGAGTFAVLPGNHFYCASPSGGVVRSDAVEIAGTAGDAFAGDWQ